MKRIIALILSLILCFSFVVSCSKEEEPTSEPTSEQPGQTPTPKDLLPADARVNYYYHKTSSTEDRGETSSKNEDFQTGIQLLKDESKYLEFIQNAGISDIELASPVFDNYYVFVRSYIRLDPDYYGIKIMGYRKATVENNVCTLILDQTQHMNAYFDSEGNIKYSLVVPGFEPTHVGCYDFIFISKASLDAEITESTTIELKKVVYDMHNK